jgi:putative two-component system response regulator
LVENYFTILKNMVLFTHISAKKKASHSFINAPIPISWPRRKVTLPLIKSIPQELTGYLHLADAVIITDSEHLILDVNKQYEATTGYSRNMIIGLKAGFIKSRHTPLSTYKSLKFTLKEGQPWSGVFINRKSSGDLWHSSMTITPITVHDQLYYIGIARELEQLQQGVYLPESKKIEVHREILKVLAISCEIRDPAIVDHLLRVQKLTTVLLNAHNKRHNLKMHPRFVHNIIHSSILHDIGKAGIPEGILYKPGPLNDYERKIVEMHPLIGTDILKKISIRIDHEFSQSLEVAENIISFHHEKWDGSGYPHQLKGKNIPFEARVVAIVDVFDALTSRRAYKDSWTKKEALSYIIEQKGTHFDPMLVETLMECLL